MLTTGLGLVRCLRAVSRPDDELLGLVEASDYLVGELKVSLDESRRRQGQPLAQADILEHSCRGARPSQSQKGRLL